MPTLTNEQDIVHLYNKSSALRAKGSIGGIIRVFNIFNALNIHPTLLEYDENDYISLPQNNGDSEHIHILRIFDCGLKLHILKKCPGFHHLSQELNNPCQFSSTMHEVDCAVYKITRPEITEVSISPKIIVNGSIKRPDFKSLTINNLEFFNECKSLESIIRAKQSKASKLLKQFEPYLLDISNIPFRIEITFKSLPTHWNRNYCEQLVMHVKTMIKLKKSYDILPNKKQETYIKLSSITEEYFSSCPIVAANKKYHPTLVIAELTNLIPDVKKIIKDALTQLPTNKPGIIFIKSINEYYAQQAISNFFINNKKEFLSGIFSYTTDFKFHPNPNSLLKLHDYISLKANPSILVPVIL